MSYTSEKNIKSHKYLWYFRNECNAFRKQRNFRRNFTERSQSKGYVCNIVKIIMVGYWVDLLPSPIEFSINTISFIFRARRMLQRYSNKIRWNWFSIPQSYLSRALPKRRAEKWKRQMENRQPKMVSLLRKSFGKFILLVAGYVEGK